MLLKTSFSNKEILLYAEALSKEFLDEENKNLELPIKVNFYLQKNIKVIIDAAETVDKLRMKIGEKYGEFNLDEQYYEIKDNEKRLEAQKELDKLFSIDQILEIETISLEDLKDTKLTVAQMNAMYFMIQE